MLEKNFNKSWKFWIDQDAFALVWDIPEEAREITLPHDAMIEEDPQPESSNGGNTGYRDGDNYNYVRLFEVPENYCDKTVMMKFEGIYMNAFIYINGQLAKKCPNGYSTFYVPMNDYLKYGEENEIRVIVRNGAMPNSRWYSGGGIYRDVYLLVSDLTYMVPDRTQIKTEAIEDDYAVVNISTVLKNRCHTSVGLRLETVIKNADGTVVSTDEVPVTLFEDGERKISRRITVDDPKLWSAETPELYICINKLYKRNEVIDESKNKFGIRILQLDTKKGLRVNGETVKLRGGCIHHDSGLLGAATYDDAQYRQVKLLKEAGFNALRMAHNPMSQSMLKACDELGMYVMDEAFDMWTRCKSDFDYGMYFQEWWERGIEAMVRKDYNHPSVILYSIGNEIPELGIDKGVEISDRITEKIKSMDQTRYTLASINGVFAAGEVVDEIVSDVTAELKEEGNIEGDVNDFMALMSEHMDRIVVHPEITKRLEKACPTTDIAGYNYMAARYEKDGEEYPNRVIVGSETYPPKIARNWELVKKCSHVIGDFTWTGWGYLGEAGVGVPAYQKEKAGFGADYPYQLAYCGDIDITGFRRPASYYREIVFGMRKKPYITVQNPHKYGEELIKTPWVISDSISSWTWKGCEGDPVIIEIYSTGEEVELICNGESLGKKPTGKETGFKTFFETVYEPGTLTAIVYEDGAEIGKMDLSTAGKKRKLVITAEKGKNNKLIYVPIEICDENGNLAIDEKVKLEIEVEGPAEVAGFGSANPKPDYNYTEMVTETFQGRALAILKMKEETGQVKVKVSPDKYQEEMITID